MADEGRRGPLVGIVLGSESDSGVMGGASEVLSGLGVPFETRIASAHRTPERTLVYARTASSRGIRVIIAGAGMAAHLAGSLAGSTLLPVIGVPLSGSRALGGMDALLSTVQMPSGVPVAAVAVDGARNAAWLAARILALSDPELEKRLSEGRDAMALAVDASDAAVGAEEGRLS
ncbi:MAG: 5-(carboxyamino)imidazole ribonucleotide mutase [Deltaproteobacteria bacterium]|jgi:phosphoribosylaminoimidazole carboxylase PurE protein|nr:5-(carboxyamino)imidazole ribonucleotide mutase [Deltaproteobacteria bacterium]